MSRSLLILLATAILALPASGTSKAPRDPIPSTQYEEREITGWRVHVNRELLEKRKEVGSRALALLETKLKEVTALVPTAALEKLRSVPIWLGVDDHDKPNAVYHPSAEWLKNHGFNPDKARSVEIPNAAVFIEWSDDQPMIVLHELAHAFHHQVIGHSRTDLRDAFRNARESKRYDQVQHVRGAMKRAYALNNVQEFFAEMSEAYFGRNDFFPFTREELKEHDPETCSLIERLWTNPN